MICNPWTTDVIRYVPAARDADAPVSNHVVSAESDTMPVPSTLPLLAPIQFPVGKSAESIALNARSVPNELSARNVRAPVEAISAGTPELLALLPITERAALLRSMALVTNALGTMPAVSWVLCTTLDTRPSRRSFVPMLISATAPELFAERPITEQAEPLARFARVMEPEGREMAPEAVRAPVETLVGVMAPRDRVMLPELVIGLPETPIPLFPVTPTEVTVPVAGATQLVLVPSVCRCLPACVACEGRKAFSAALAVVCPLPPLAIGSAVPE